jgi:hypothetical protein
MNRILMIDPPSGYRYGFPKPVPEAGTIYYGSEYDYGLQKDFKLFEWLVAEGYPQEEIDKCGDTFVSRFWTVPKNLEKEA